MDINDFTSIAIVGITLSLIVEGIKTKFGTNSFATKVLTVILALVFGGFYWAAQGTEFYQAVLGVLAAASTFYALFLNSSKSSFGGM